MFSKSMTNFTNIIGKTGSIAARLTFWYALLSVVLIVISGSALYWVLADRLRKEDDQLLTGRIAEMRAILELHPIESAVFREEIQREAAMLPGIYLRLLDADGGIVVETLATRAAFSGKKFATYNSSSIENEQGADWLLHGEMYRTMSGRIAIGSGFTAQVAMNRSAEEEALTIYRRILWLTVSAVLAISVAAGYLVARRNLKPVSRLASIIAELSAAHLHRRVADDEWPQELRPLADNFDQLLARLDETFARISRFSADIAHELRTPLHILQGEAEIALSKPRPIEEYRECIESAAEEYHRLARMVDSMLFLARTEQADAVLERKSLKLEHEIATVISFYQAFADEQEVLLVTHGEGEVVADPSFLRRVLSNLIANALRYTPSGGQIVVFARETTDREIEITVSDTGAGIASEDLPHVFNRFYRSDSSRSRQDSGSGLGLAIAQSIMKLHRGSITIQSTLQKGTKVTLRFPATPSSLVPNQAMV